MDIEEDAIGGLEECIESEYEVLNMEDDDMDIRNSEIDEKGEKGRHCAQKKIKNINFKNFYCKKCKNVVYTYCWRYTDDSESTEINCLLGRDSNELPKDCLFYLEGIVDV